MAIVQANSISYYDTNSGVTDDNVTYKSMSPSMSMAAGTYVLKDLTRFNNEVFKFYVRFSDVTNTHFKLMIGIDNMGTGRAVHFDFSSTDAWVRLVNTSGLDQTYDTVITEHNLYNRMTMVNDQFVECRAEIVNGNFQFYFNGMRVLQSTAFTANANYFGFCNLTTGTQVYVSDVEYIYDQIIWGNVNLDGNPQAEGIVGCYKQSTLELYKYIRCLTNGAYMIFIDDDPVNANKYFIYGYVKDQGIVQPRGISNITI